MASSNINVKLSLKDQFTKPLKVAAKGTKEFESQLKYAQKSAKSMATSFSNNVVGALTKVAKTAATAATALGTVALTTGIKEAASLQSYRMQLETVTKSAERASEVMKYMTELANVTPFEAGDVIGAATRLESAGLDSTKYITAVGDMAAIWGADLETAANSFVKAMTTGQMQSMQMNFAITKDQVNEFAKSMMGLEVIDKSGSIKNMQKWQEALVGLMNSKYAGGMEKQASTISGLMSTISGLSKNYLAQLVGVESDGAIRSGSMFEVITKKITEFTNKMLELGQSGALDEFKKKFDEGFSKLLDTAVNSINWFIENANWLVPLLKNIGLAVGGLAVGIKVINSLSAAWKAMNIVWNVSKVLMSALSLKFIIIGAGIGIAIAGAIALWKNWDTVCSWIKQAVDSLMNKFESAKEGFTNWVDGIKKQFEPLIEIFNNAKESFEKLKNSAVGQAVGGAINWVGNKLSGHALGTTYFKGGMTGINEHGGEAAILPSGTQIIPHDQTQKMAANTTYNVNVNISGNVLGDEEYANYLGGVIVSRLKEVAVNS